MPLLLAAPAVWLVKRHTTELRSAEQVLQQAIHRLDSAIVDIADLDRLRQAFANQNLVLEALEADRALMLRLLNALGTLPVGLQLTAATAGRGEVVLVGVAIEPPIVAAAVEALRAAGLDEVEIIRGQTLDGAGPGPFEIRARYDGLSTRQSATRKELPQLLARAARMTPP